MVTETTAGKFDICEVGQGEGLYGLDVWELERLKDEIMSVLAERKLTGGNQ